MGFLVALASLGAGCSDGEPGARQVGGPRLGTHDGGVSGPGDAGVADASPGHDVAPAHDARSMVDWGAVDDLGPLADLAWIDDAAPLDAAPPAPDGGPRALCGDGERAGDEACDDGNRLDGDYCAADCRAVTGRCGDGVLQNIELCDDGRIEAGCEIAHGGGDGTCLPPGECADGFVLAGDDCRPELAEVTVDIFVANDCTMGVVPPSYDVPPGQRASFTYRNRSVDYPVDVWLSYGGGFLDLPPGEVWDDQFEHCGGGRRPYQAGADISTACSEHRFVINCQ